MAALPVKTNANKKLAPREKRRQCLSAKLWRLFSAEGEVDTDEILEVILVLDAFGMWLEPKWVYR